MVSLPVHEDHGSTMWKMAVCRLQRQKATQVKFQYLFIFCLFSIHFLATAALRVSRVIFWVVSVAILWLKHQHTQSIFLFFFIVIQLIKELTICFSPLAQIDFEHFCPRGRGNLMPISANGG